VTGKVSRGKHGLGNTRKSIRNAHSCVRDLMCDICVHTVWMTCQSIAGLERAGRVKTGSRELIFGNGALVV